MSAARVLAQAKVNLFLHVLAREAGGHHQLETLFQRLELGDDVAVRVGGRGRTLDCRGADVGPVERNLAWRAAEAYAEAAGWPHGFAIEIDKRIPVGGGLGGGSADAGAVLRLLDALAPRPLAADALLALAGRLGADVPFLATDAARALAWGRGDRLQLLPPLPRRQVALVLPPVGVATADAYAWLAEARAGAVAAPRALAADQLATWAGVAAVAANDFEAPVAARVAAVAAVAEARALFEPPLPPGVVPGIFRMSGSGSSWFLVIADERLSLAVESTAAWRVVWTHSAERAAPIEPLA